MNQKAYINQLTTHYQNYFGVQGERLSLNQGPTHRLHPDFFVLKWLPVQKHPFYCYATVGMSVGLQDNLVELVVYSPVESQSLVELLTASASFHRNSQTLGLHHTVNIGQPWLADSDCEYGFISLPYLDGPDLELFEFECRTVHCYWFIPVTKDERDYKVQHGWEALEQLFEDKELDYLNPLRSSMINYA